MPKVSVIIPNYNHCNYLKERIDSVLGQTFQDYEVILMDDCSTDDSVAVLESYRSHPKVSKILVNPQNGGNTFKQWNKGIAKSKGEFIWLAESDDIADPRFLEVMTARLEANPKAGLVFCQSYMIDKDSQNQGIVTEVIGLFDPPLPWQHDFTLNIKNSTASAFTRNNFILNASAVLLRKNVYTQIKGADESYQLGGDWLTWLKIGLISEIDFCSQPLNYYRFHSNNVRSRTKKSQYYEFFRIMYFLHQYPGLAGWVKEQAHKRMMGLWRQCKENKDEIGLFKIRKAYFILWMLDKQKKLSNYFIKYTIG